MGIRIHYILLAAIALIILTLAAASCNKPPQDKGAGAAAGTKPTATTASTDLPKLQEYGADW
jgi:hypothetical protein